MLDRDLRNKNESFANAEAIKQFPNGRASPHKFPTSQQVMHSIMGIRWVATTNKNGLNQTHILVVQVVRKRHGPKVTPPFGKTCETVSRQKGPMEMGGHGGGISLEMST